MNMNMDLESTMPEAAIDPQLQLLTGNPAPEAMPEAMPDTMPFSYSSTSFEPWNSMFESMGEFPQATDSDPFSDTCSSFSMGNDQFFMSPVQGATFNPDDSPSNTSIGSISELGGVLKPETSTNTDITPKKNASKTTKTKKGHRRARSETEAKEQVKQRNRVAASKCRQKKKVKTDELKEMQLHLEAQNNDLRNEFQRLREEVGQLKSVLINHNSCNDPNINRWVANQAQGFVKKLVENDERQRMESISSMEGNPMGGIQMQSLGDPYMGLDQ
ncbi:hypothetical protein ACQKWADRAFT_202866 [Trichoderma austrokoningii]